MIVDTNVSLSRWPFRRLPGDEPVELVARLRQRGVAQAWAGSFDGVLHKDIAAVNNRLAADCAAHGDGLLLPFGSVNPRLPAWEEDLRRCREEHKMPGIRLHPNYHRYSLAEPAFADVLRLATQRGLLVQIAACMEDERTQNALMVVLPVDLAPLAEKLKAEPKARVMVLNCRQNAAELSGLSAAGNVWFDFSMLEGVGCVDRLAASVSLERVVFGSHSPFYYFESAVLKVRESDLSEPEKKLVLEENARRILGRR